MFDEKESPSEQDEKTTTFDDKRGLWIGWNIDGTEVVLVDKGSLKRHMTVLGSTGSGKTVLCKAVVEEAILADIPVIAIDPQGDIVRLGMMGNKETLKEKNIPVEFLEAYKNKVGVAIFTPGSSDGIKIVVDPVNSFPKEKDRADIKESSILKILSGISSTIVSLFEMSSKKELRKSQHLIYKALELAYRENTYLENIVQFFSFLEDENTKGKLSETVSKEIMKSYSSLLSELEMILEGPTATLFRDGVPLDLDVLLDKKFGKVPLNIFYLNSLEDENLKQFFLSYLGNEIYAYMLRKGKINVLLFIDEVKLFLPPGTQKTLSKEILLTLLEQGRKYGLSMLMATQSPGKIDYQAFGQCNTRAYGILSTKQDLDKIKDSVPDYIKDELPTLVSGNFYLQNIKGVFQKIRVRWLYTDHGEPIPVNKLRGIMSDEIINYYENLVTTISKNGVKKEILEDKGEITAIEPVPNDITIKQKPSEQIKGKEKPRKEGPPVVSMREVKETFDYRDLINLFSCEDILIIHKDSGICLFEYHISKLKVDPQLLSGFLTAITSLFTEIKTGSSIGNRAIIRSFSEEIGDNVFEIFVCEGNSSVTAVLLSRKLKFPNLFRRRLRNFAYAFEENFQQYLEKFIGDISSFTSAVHLLDCYLGLSLTIPLHLDTTYDGYLTSSPVYKAIVDQMSRLADNEGVYTEEIIDSYIIDLNMTYKDIVKELLVLIKEKVLIPIDTTRKIPDIRVERPEKDERIVTPSSVDQNMTKGYKELVLEDSNFEAKIGDTKPVSADTLSGVEKEVTELVQDDISSKVEDEETEETIDVDSIDTEIRETTTEPSTEKTTNIGQRVYDTLSNWKELLDSVPISPFTNERIESILKRNVIYESNCRVNTAKLEVREYSRSLMEEWGINLANQGFTLTSTSINPLKGKKVFLSNNVRTLIVSFVLTKKNTYIVIVTESIPK